MRSRIELLAPAKDAATGITAIAHGADAVYIGPPAFGARRQASNSIDDIRRLVEYAHPYRARIYATVNTLVYEHELKDVEHLVWDLYRAGVDALIVQDMALLRLDIPPIELHASTQCDIRTPEKALFLEKVGFSQLVLARELELREIEDICSTVSVPMETFIHGALCVSYSGRCHASFACNGRSANRGECSQMCRLPYTMRDGNGRILVADKHLLSLHDLNLSDRLEALLNVGVRSFKIEGRLKDMAYVKNITAYYRRKLDDIIAAHPDRYERKSFGECGDFTFDPALAKSFNRGFTHYFLDGSRPRSLVSALTPKSLGEEVEIPDLNNGDGIAFFDKNGNYRGVRVNSVDIVSGRISTYGDIPVPRGIDLRRTYDRVFEQSVGRSNPMRTIAVHLNLNGVMLCGEDERGVAAAVNISDIIEDGEADVVKMKQVLSKTGGTVYRVDKLEINLPEGKFIRPGKLAQARRMLVGKLDAAASATYPYGNRRQENKDVPYIAHKLTYADNVANSLSESFYKEHGVISIEPAMETAVKSPMNTANSSVGRLKVMTCRHCILRETGRCLKEHPGGVALPITIENGTGPSAVKFELRFNCARCEMEVWK